MEARNSDLCMRDIYLKMKIENVFLQKELVQARRDIRDLEYQLKKALIERHFIETMGRNSTGRRE